LEECTRPTQERNPTTPLLVDFGSFKGIRITGNPAILWNLTSRLS